MRESTTGRRLGGRTAAAVSLAAIAALGPGAVPAGADEPVDTVRLTEDFSSGELPEGWTGHLGTWQVKDGRLEGTSVNGQRARLTFGTSYTNYRLEAKASFLQVADESRWLNLAADYHGAEDYGSVFVVRSNTKLSNGLEYAVAKAPGAAYASPVTAAAGVALGVGQTHDLSLEVRGTKAVLAIDGVPSLTATDVHRSGGTLGLVVNNATVAFDDVKVTELAPEATAPSVPSSLRLSQKDTSATVRWAAPADPGKTPGGAAATVTGYEVAIGAPGAAPGGLAWTATAKRSHTFRGLEPGAYRLWVRAVNGAGKKGEAASVNATPGVPKIKGFARTLNGGEWSAGHVQGIAVDRKKKRVYYSFTTLLVKTDFEGNVLGTLGGFTGHLGDLDFNEKDGRVYGSLEYKEQKAFYIAVIDVDELERVGMEGQNSAVFQTVYLNEVVADYTADMNGDGVFDGNVGNTPDHRYGSSGIDGVSFGPRFGSTGGADYLTVAYGVYANANRTDNDHQVLLQYDIKDWRRYARPLSEAAPHTSGPAKVSGKYFVFTGNTNYGVQNLEYDEALERWFLGVYKGSKPAYPNYTMFAVDAAAKPVMGELAGTGGDGGLLLALADDGLADAATGVRGWNQKADVGVESLGGGLFYLAKDGSRNGRQTADLTLSRWTGDAAAPFAPVSGEADLLRAPVFTSAVPAGAVQGERYRHVFTASGLPRASFEVGAGGLPQGLSLDRRSGVLSGVPGRSGVFSFTVRAVNAAGSAEQAVVLRVEVPRRGR